MTQKRWRLDGQTALITGASAGIGLAIAHELAGFGADLMIVGRDIDMLETARDELLDVYPQMQVHALAADVSDDEDDDQEEDWSRNRFGEDTMNADDGEGGNADDDVPPLATAGCGPATVAGGAR